MVRNKSGGANKSSTKASSVDDILLQEEEEAIRRQNEMTMLPEDDKDSDGNHSEGEVGTGGEQVGEMEERLGEVVEDGINRRKRLIVDDPDELQMLLSLRESKRLKGTMGFPTPSSSADRSSYSDRTPSSLSLSATEDRPRQDSKKKPVLINLPSDQLQINDLGVDRVELAKIENSPHFAGLVTRCTSSKYYVKLADQLPRHFYSFYFFSTSKLTVFVLAGFWIKRWMQLLRPYIFGKRMTWARPI